LSHWRFAPAYFFKGIAVMLLFRRAWNILRERRRYWLMPIAVMLIVSGILFLVSAGGRLVSVIHSML
jgi:hypothetical protein